MKQLWRRHWFLTLLLAVLIVGMAFAEPWVELPRRFPTRWLVALVLFLMAFTLDTGALLCTVRRPLAAALAIGVNMLLLPLLAWGAVTLFPSPFAPGVLIAAALPCTMASAAVWTLRGGGNEAVALVTTLVTSFACFAVTPFWLQATTGLEIETPAMMQDLLITAVLPMTLGQLARWPRPAVEVATRYKRQVSVFNQCGILTMVLIGAIQSAPALRGSAAAELGWQTWLGMAALAAGVHTAGLLLGFGLGKGAGFARADWIPVGIAGSQKTLMIGLHLATLYEAQFGPLAVLPLVAYHVLQLVLDTVVVDHLARTAPPARLAAPAEEEMAEGS